MKKIGLLELASLISALQAIPCYDESELSERFRLCSHCTFLAVDVVAKFAIKVLSHDDDAPPGGAHHDEELPVETGFRFYP